MYFALMLCSFRLKGKAFIRLDRRGLDILQLNFDTHNGRTKVVLLSREAAVSTSSVYASLKAVPLLSSAPKAGRLCIAAAFVRSDSHLNLPKSG